MYKVIAKEVISRNIAQLKEKTDVHLQDQDWVHVEQILWQIAAIISKSIPTMIVEMPP